MGSQGYMVDFVRVIDLDYLDKKNISKDEYFEKNHFVVFYREGCGEYEFYSKEPIGERFINKFLMEFTDIYDITRVSDSLVKVTPIHPYRDFDSAENNAIQFARNLVEFYRYGFND